MIVEAVSIEATQESLTLNVSVGTDTKLDTHAFHLALSLEVLKQATEAVNAIAPYIGKELSISDFGESGLMIACPELGCLKFGWENAMCFE